MRKSTVSMILFCAISAFADGGYTNHAGNVIAGWPVKLTQKEVALAEGTTNSQLSTTNSQPQTSNIKPQTSNSQLSTFNFQLSTTNTFRAAAHRGGLRAASRAGRGEARYHGGGEGDGAIAQARGEGALHEGGERRLLREVRCRPQELPRQAGQRGHDHPRRAKGSWALTPRWLILTWAGHTVSAKMV